MTRERFSHDILYFENDVGDGPGRLPPPHRGSGKDDGNPIWFLSERVRHRNIVVSKTPGHVRFEHQSIQYNTSSHSALFRYSSRSHLRRRTWVYTVGRRTKCYHSISYTTLWSSTTVFVQRPAPATPRRVDSVVCFVWTNWRLVFPISLHVSCRRPLRWTRLFFYFIHVSS